MNTVPFANASSEVGHRVPAQGSATTTTPSMAAKWGSVAPATAHATPQHTIALAVTTVKISHWQCMRMLPLPVLSLLLQGPQLHTKPL
eukprot:8363534-Alexandrium_andersonii.AAC.1